MAAGISDRLEINAHNEVAILILYIPQQLAKNAFEQIAIRARTLAATTYRTSMDTMREIDARVLKTALDECCPEKRGIIF